MAGFIRTDVVLGSSPWQNQVEIPWSLNKLTHSLGPSAGFQSARFYRPWVQQQSSTGAGHKTRRDAGDSGSGHVEFKIGHHPLLKRGNWKSTRIWNESLNGKSNPDFPASRVWLPDGSSNFWELIIIFLWLWGYTPVSEPMSWLDRQLDAAGHFLGYFSGLKRHKEVAIDEQCAFFLFFSEPLKFQTWRSWGSHLSLLSFGLLVLHSHRGSTMFYHFSLAFGVSIATRHFRSFSGVQRPNCCGTP